MMFMKSILKLSTAFTQSKCNINMYIHKFSFLKIVLFQKLIFK